MFLIINSNQLQYPLNPFILSIFQSDSWPELYHKLFVLPFYISSLIIADSHYIELFWKTDIRSWTFITFSYNRNCSKPLFSYTWIIQLSFCHFWIFPRLKVIGILFLCIIILIMEISRHGYNLKQQENIVCFFPASIVLMQQNHHRHSNIEYCYQLLTPTTSWNY